MTAFQSWLQDLSRDADRSDLCPNLAYIPLSRLRRLWREGCAPGAEAVIAHQWKKRSKPAVAADEPSSPFSVATVAGDNGK